MLLAVLKRKSGEIDDDVIIDNSVHGFLGADYAVMDPAAAFASTQEWRATGLTPELARSWFDRPVHKHQTD